MNTTRTVTERQEQLNGMALGGIGTGTVEIRPNGCLEDWEIFNLGQWACSDPEKTERRICRIMTVTFCPFISGQRRRMDSRWCGSFATAGKSEVFVQYPIPL